LRCLVVAGENELLLKVALMVGIERDINIYRVARVQVELGRVKRE